MLSLWIISLCILLFYFLCLLAYGLGWRRVSGPAPNAGKHSPEDLSATAGQQNTPEQSRPGVSVVIPVRNEETGIGLLLNDLKNQEDTGADFEIIVVDDHSTDRTGSVVESFRANNPVIRLISLGLQEWGKTDALRKGIRAAVHPVILNTDGDCRIPSRWVSNTKSVFTEPGVRMQIGTVLFESHRGALTAMQSLEHFGLTAVSGGAAGWNDPILCSGANLAYFREDYIGFAQQDERPSESGDDVFFMLWLKKKYPGSIRFASSPESAVRTRPPAGLVPFIMQRMRWASKGRHYRDVHTIGTALLVYIMNAVLLVLLLLFLLDPSILSRWQSHALKVFGILFAGKAIADLLFLMPVLRHYGKIRLLRWFLPLEIVYFAYVSLIGLFGQMIPFSWKGRRVPVMNTNHTVGRRK